MRRGSVIGPLILIGIGLLFLVYNLAPQIRVTELLARYWPLLLIVWGGLRLIEILFWAVLSKPIPRNGISGGEWVLVFFICIIGGVAYAAHNYSGWFPNGRALRGFVVDLGESYDYTLPPAARPCAKNCRVVIESFRGNAKITGADITEVRVNGRKTIRSFQQPDADQANRDTPAELIAQGDQIIIRTNQDRASDRMRVSDDLDITVPAGSSVEAHGRTGDFDIGSITGSVNINSDNAGVHLENIGGNVRVETRRSDILRATDVKGTVELLGRGQDIELQNIGGPITVTGTYVGQLQLHNLSQPLRYEGQQMTLDLEKLPGEIHVGAGELSGNNIVGPVRLSARARDIQLTDFTQSLDLNVDRGDVSLRPGRTVPKLEVHVRLSGDIDLALPPSAKFDLKAATDRGEAHNEYGSPLKVDDSRRGGSIEGIEGSGPQLRLDTRRGTVTVRKASEEELANRPAPAKNPNPPLKAIEQ